MRVLVAASGGEGHLGPLLPFAAAARDAGDEVVIVVPPELAATVRAERHSIVVSAGVAPAASAAIRRAMAVGDDSTRSRLAEVELFGRLCTAAALPTITAVCADFRPDLILREPCDYASAIVARREGIPTAQVAISPGGADWTGLHLAAEVVEPLEPGTTALVERAPCLTRFPDADAPFPDLRVYGFATAPIRRAAPDAVPLIWISFGTVNGAFEALAGTWAAALEAVGSLPVVGIASVGRSGGRLRAPDNVEVVDWVALPRILEQASLVICHGGSGTTLAALAAGLPVVVVPMLADQPANAGMVERLGAGIAVQPAPSPTPAGLTAADVPQLRAAILQVLTDERYAEAARRTAQQSAGRPSVEAALQRLRLEVG